MENFLKNLVEQKQLAEIEQVFDREITSLDNETYDVKLAVMLALLAERCLNRIDRVDTSDFPAKLAGRLDIIDKDNRIKLAGFIARHRENQLIMERIGSADGDLQKLNSQIGEMMARYESILRAIVADRDTLPVGALG